MNSPRWLASSLVLTLSLQSLAFAGGEANPFAALPPSIQAEAQPQKAVQEAQTPRVTPALSFEQKLEMYIETSRNGNALLANRFKNQISAEVFSHAGTARYIEMLRQIDARTVDAPEATYDLAKTLQLRWESRYAQGLGQLKLDTRQRSTQIGMIVGVIAFGALLWKKPQVAPRYFSLLRRILPHPALATGVAAATTEAGMALIPAWVAKTGAESGAQINSLRDILRATPPAPAHLMRLGIVADDSSYSPNQLMNEVSALAAGTAAGMAAYRMIRTLQAVRAASTAATIASAPTVPPVVVASILALGVSLAAEKAVTYGIDQHEFGKLSGRVTTARNLMDWSLDAQDDTVLFRSSDALVLTARQLSNYLNREIEAANVELVEAQNKAAQKYGVHSKAYQREIAELVKDFSEKVSDAYEEQDQRGNSDAEALLVLSLLANHDHAALEGLNEPSKARAEMVLRGYQVWNERAANTERASTLSGFQTYVRGLIDAKNRSLTQELREGRLSRNPNRVLLQAAAFIRSTGKDYIEDRADELMAMIARNEMMVNLAVREGTEVK